MGYRSQVRCLIYGSPEKLDGFILAQQLILNNPVFTEFRDALVRYSVKFGNEIIHVLDLYGDDWKWYESNSDVIAWMTMMHEAPTFDLNFEFIRVGEDNSDVEQICSEKPEGLLSTQTYVEITDDFAKHEDIPLTL